LPDRVIRDELLDSERWLSLKRNTHRLAFVCLLLRCDAFGNLEGADGQLWRAWRDPLNLQDRAAIPEILEALISADLLRVYEAGGKRYLHIPRTRFRLRYVNRVCPLSPWTTTEEKQILTKNSPGANQEQTGSAPDSRRPSKEKLREVGVKVLGVVSENKLRLARATRLPADWSLPDHWKTWAVTVHHLEPDRVVRISLGFRDFWIAKAGADAAKLDWFATFRNWIRRETHDA
jgi:hypothetical protein